MKIIAVNISKALRGKTPILTATERAWWLRLDICKQFDFVISVAGGNIYSYYKLISVNMDILEPTRVKFELIECTLIEKKSIDSYILKSKCSVSGFVTKYIR